MHMCGQLRDCVLRGPRGDMTQRGMCLAPEPAGVHDKSLHVAIFRSAVLAVQVRLLFWRQARRCGLDA